jgi:hypothetical protein
VTLVQEWAVVLHVIVVPAIGAEALEGFERGGRGVGPGSIAPAIGGALRCVEAGKRGRGMGGRRLRWIKNKVGDVADNSSTEEVSLCQEPFLHCTAEAIFGPSKGNPLLLLFDFGSMVVGNFSHHPNVFEPGDGIVD